jgi:hypothetical protein
MGNGSGSQGSGKVPPGDQKLLHINEEDLASRTWLANYRQRVSNAKEELKKEEEERKLKKKREEEEAALKKEREGEAARRWKADHDAMVAAGVKSAQDRQKLLDAVDPKIGERIVGLAEAHWTAAQTSGRSPWQRMGPDPNANPVTASVSDPKCNIFLENVLAQAKAPVPMIDGRPPRASEWADPNVKIGRWEVVLIPRPGDVAAAGEHVGIVVAGDHTISQSTITDNLERTKFGFRDDTLGKVVYRRYVP